MQPVPYSVPGDIRATLVRILAYMGGLGLLAILAASLFRDEAVVAAVNPAPRLPRPEWISVDRPHPAFELQMPEWASSNTDYAILRRTSDGSRRDMLSWGDPAASGPYVSVEIDRPGSAGAHFIDAPSEIAARLVAFSVVDDVKPAGDLGTKFGTVPLVDFAIGAGIRGDGQAQPRRCLGFATPFDKPLMQISGWYCSPGEEVVDRSVLSCALDRLTMLSSGNDPDVAALFARAEVKRTFCGQRSPILAATPEHALLAPHDPKFAHGLKLRGRIWMR